jgi:hypothetical protein
MEDYTFFAVAGWREQGALSLPEDKLDSQKWLSHQERSKPSRGRAEAQPLQPKFSLNVIWEA